MMDMGPGKEPVSMTLLTMDSVDHVLVGELARAMQSHGLSASKTTLQRKLKAYNGGHAVMAAPPKVLLDLKRMGVLSSYSPTADLCKTKAAAWVIKNKFNVPPSVAASLLQPITTIIPPPPNPSPAPPLPQANSSSPAALPNRMPLASNAPVEAVHAKRYGLTQVARNPKVVKQLEVVMNDFQSWCTDTIRLDRPSSVSAAVKTDTWKNIKDNCMQYLGYCHAHEGIDTPSLLHYLRPDLFAHFYAFLREKQLAKTTVLRHLKTAQRVVAYLQSTGEGLQQGEAEMVRVMDYYQEMNRQVTCHGLLLLVLAGPVIGCEINGTHKCMHIHSCLSLY